MSARSLPPFGAELRRWLRADPKSRMWGCNGSKPSITIVLGSDAWSFAREWNGIRLVLIVPPGEYASRFNWHDCAGADPVLIQLCGDVADGAIDSLVRALMRDGTKRVLELATMVRFEAEAVRHAA